MKHSLLLAAFTLILATPLPSLADDVCHACVERKRAMCAKECELVPPAKSLVCQRDCSFQYCNHRCKSNNPIFGNFRELSCTKCLDTQYGLCSSSCSTGSDRVRAMCKIECADKRCQEKCLGKPAEGPPQSPDDLDEDEEFELE